MTTLDLAPSGAGAPRVATDCFGHPKGLLYLAFAETWERFSYSGMQALLVLYMVEQLLLPGHVEHVAGFAAFRASVLAVTGPLTPAATASVIFGLYTGLVYVTPLIGGFLADRWFGRTAMVTAGAILMAIGHFLMAFEASFLLALACLIVGVGGFKGNISTQVGALYAEGDHRRAQAFQVFYMGINVGLIFAPLVCGTLGERVGWHWGFGAAGVGMLVGLAIYLSGRRWLPPEPVRGASDERIKPPALSREEWLRTVALVGLLPILAGATLGNYQIFNTYLVWAKDSYDLSLFGQAMPVTWLLSFGGFTSVGLIALSVTFWNWWGRRWREPSELGKIAIGAAIMALAPLILSAAAIRAQDGHKVSLGWAVAFELVNDLGYANLVPVSYALFTRLAPPQIAGTMVAVCLLQFFLVNLMVGALGTLLAPLGGPAFWLLHAAIVGGAAAVFMLLWRIFGARLAVS
ncbi:peptide MFS transporter [Phenylobacterium montanum]|uniref:Peptide MFS transporter n=1 Tax=Phenylobacterium montanum TaxID=2823693 RepID=A0A975IYE2_9CAUL|nr:peptide MFS transporter [Caulobacter sp. S6]QUD90361.1 peptide MFS transporter [Caulobacter sp. S6]